jgi:molecular chaperone GrpE (heat shock protein)
MFGFFTKAEAQEQLRQNIFSDVKKICSEELSSVKNSLASLGDSLKSSKDSLASLGDLLKSSMERLSDMNEWEQQAQRQERRRHMALETLLENQNKILEKLQPSPPLEALMALAENLALAYLARPADKEFSVLYNKLTDLLACFNLSLVVDEGSRFDPTRHEACAAFCNRARPEDSVLEIVRPGFLLKGKALRCATVVVNRYDAEPESPRLTSNVPVPYRNLEPEWEGKLYD